ncbi:dephospho-CoA kinase [Desulfosarcina sp. OttesenSCG-928-A07]|nr:dephospho-CoA kinase [Desulfosarcina sp. OttesenSCG-928-G17]MDL2330328.1 dephospho-CoA kinase [Desulfosarcina sp. OttesenSCG-928-A07]
MIIVGLTGGIASGKSTVSRFLGELGAVIVDADKIARDVVEPGTPAHQEIVRTFGTGILLPDHSIDRKGLGDIIFNEPAKKEQLNAIVHPRVFEAMNAKIAKAAAADPGAVIILDVPLLFEAGSKRDLSEIIVVYSPEAVQLRRLMKRDQIDEKAAMARIRSQMPIEEKRKRATLVIDNTENSDKTKAQARHVFQYLLERAALPSTIPDSLHRVQG